MKKLLTTMATAAVAALALTAPLAAQSRSTVDAGMLDAAVAVRSDLSRARVTSALTSPRANAVAASMGLSPAVVATRIAALDDAGAAQVAGEILSGGDSSIVISTTAIIIGLLLIILLTRA